MFGVAGPVVRFSVSRNGPMDSVDTRPRVSDRSVGYARETVSIHRGNCYKLWQRPVEFSQVPCAHNLDVARYLNTVINDVTFPR